MLRRAAFERDCSGKNAQRFEGRSSIHGGRVYLSDTSSGCRILVNTADNRHISNNLRLIAEVAQNVGEMSGLNSGYGPISDKPTSDNTCSQALTDEAKL